MYVLPKLLRVCRIDTSHTLRTVARGFCHQVSSQDTPYISCLHARGVLLLSGAEVGSFLQGLLTNDVRPLSQEGAPPVYAAVLTAKGKFLHDMFIHRHHATGDEQAMLMDVDATGKASLVKLLNQYKLRRHVKVTDVSSEYQVWVKFGLPDSKEEGMWRRDPRLPQLGFRSIFASNQPPSVTEGQQLCPEANYVAWRCTHGVPEGEQEIPVNEVNPLEYNLDVLNGVSYTKGCYVGQERNSFIHYRGVVRKRVMPVILQPSTTDMPPGTELLCPATSQPVGTLRAAAGNVGLAFLKLAPALKAATSRQPLLVSGTQVTALPVRPDWWPGEWGREEG